MAKVLIIAEAGVNHNGDVGIAKRLIEKAADAGADYVKFQTFRADSLAAPQAGKAAYQRRAAQVISAAPSSSAHRSSTTRSIW